MARLCTCSKDKVTTIVGKTKDVQQILYKLNADPGHIFKKKEDSLLLRAFLGRSATDLTLKASNEIAEEIKI